MMRTPLGPSLPIDAVLNDLLSALAGGNRVVLQAPPGAGKSTRVPLALRGSTWLSGRMLMLEPRRLAARAVAHRMASLLGERVGDTVGFRMRGETRVGPQTEIEVVTEGVLTRMLLHDPSLEDVGALLFDEFHERSIHADLGLALALQSQEVLRPELRILVMSATLDARAVSEFLGDARVIESAGRSFPVSVSYAPRRIDARVEESVAAAIRNALAHDSGSILAFLPGAAEIRRCEALLPENSLPADVRIVPLYGDLSSSAQDAAVRPPAANERKVVLATSIAETSLTIEGVRIVVDSGLSRISRFSPRSGMARLETVRVSRASAEQRAGRAGRTAPGVCYRLWAQEEHAALLQRARPEILEADLTPLALDLAAAGVVNHNDLRWLDSPPLAALTQARELLRQLGAIDDSDRLTPHGRSIAALGIHPRLAHMLIVGHERDTGATACVIAALLEERDFLRGKPSERDPDLLVRIELVASGSSFVPRAIHVRIQSLRHSLRVKATERIDDASVGGLVALAYPDRVAIRRSVDGRYVLRNGIGAVLPSHSRLWRDEFLAVADLDGRSPDAAIFLAAAMQREDVMRDFAQDVEINDVIEWNADAGAIRATRQERLGAIVLREVRGAQPDPDQVTRILVAELRAENSVALAWSRSAVQLRDRVAFLRERDPRWPDWSTAALRDSLEVWLGPHLAAVRRRSEIAALPLYDILFGSLDWEARQQLDRRAPTHVVVPTGSRIPVDYSDSSAPRIAVRLQELFGVEESPTVNDGAVPLTVELLSPAHRPVQVTNDLAGFWKTSYFDVRREMRGRYPRHEWPEDPVRALPTKRAKPRK